MRIGFVGVGKIGHPMCRRFVEGGYEVVAYDVDDGALSRIAELGAARGTSAADVAARSDVAFCCLPTPAAVEQVVAGADGLLAGAGAGRRPARLAGRGRRPEGGGRDADADRGRRRGGVRTGPAAARAARCV